MKDWCEEKVLTSIELNDLDALRFKLHARHYYGITLNFNWVTIHHS